MGPDTLSDADRRFLDATISLAGRGLFTTTPNPRVGCLLVRDGRIIGRGWHQFAGGDHAEAAALADARQRGENTTGATCYVSLEPCSHTGRTGPCSDALIAAGVTRVVAALDDPTPAVAGQGFARLRSAGVRVDRTTVMAAHDINRGYLRRVGGGRPWVRLKLAASIDGRTALASGASKWITGEAARSDVQYWRARSCAVVTGAGTVLADDARLTVREAHFAFAGSIRQPLRVVLDGSGRIGPDATLFDEPGSVLIFTGSKALEHRHRAGVDVEALAGDRPDMAEVLKRLASRGCNEVLVECGATLAGEVLRRGLWDELILYQAPRFFGAGGRPLADLDIGRMEDVLAADITDVRMVGADLRVCMSRQSH